MLKKDSTQIRPLVLLTFAVIGTVVAILGWVFVMSSNLAWVAIAMGSISGHTNVPSAQGFLANYQRGFRSFQVDMMLTRDDQPCAFSHWGSLADDLGVPLRFADVDEKTFLSRTYHGSLTPLCLKELTALLKQHADVSFVIDVKDSRSRNAEQDKKNYGEAYQRVFQKMFREWADTREYWARVIPIVHSEADLNFLKTFYRFSSVAFSLDRIQGSEDALILTVTRHPEVTSVIVSKEQASKTLLTNMKAHRIRVYVSPVDDPKVAAELGRKGVNGFFTNHLPPKPRLD